MSTTKLTAQDFLAEIERRLSSEVSARDYLNAKGAIDEYEESSLTKSIARIQAFEDLKAWIQPHVSEG